MKLINCNTYKLHETLHIHSGRWTNEMLMITEFDTSRFARQSRCSHDVQSPSQIKQTYILITSNYVNGFLQNRISQTKGTQMIEIEKNWFLREKMRLMWKMPNSNPPNTSALFFFLSREPNFRCGSWIVCQPSITFIHPFIGPPHFRTYSIFPDFWLNFFRSVSFSMSVLKCLIIHTSMKSKHNRSKIRFRAIVS